MNAVPLDQSDDFEIFKRIADESPNMIVFTSESGLVYANKTAQRITGRSNDELCKTEFDIKRLITPRDRELIGNISEVLKNPKYNSRSFLITAISKKGKETPLMVNTHIMKYAGKRHLAVFATDITELKKKEMDLYDANERFRAVMDAYPDGVLITDNKTKIIEANDAFSKQTGYGKNMIIGKNACRLPMLVKKEIPKYLKLAANVLNGKNPKSIEVDWKSKSGEIRKSRLHIETLKKNNQIYGVTIVTQEITAQKKAENELKNKLAELEKFQKFAVNRELKMIELKKRLAKKCD